MADFNPGPPIGSFAWLDQRAREDQEMHMRRAAESRQAEAPFRGVTRAEIEASKAAVAKAEALVPAVHEFITERYDDPFERAIVSRLLKGDFNSRELASSYVQEVYPGWDWTSSLDPWAGDRFAPWFARRAAEAGIDPVEVRWPTFEWVAPRFGDGRWKESFSVERGWKLPCGSSASQRGGGGGRGSKPYQPKPLFWDAHVLTDGRFLPCDATIPVRRREAGLSLFGFNLYGVATMAEILGFLPSSGELPDGVALELPESTAPLLVDHRSVEVPAGTPEQQARFEAEWSEIDRFVRRNDKLVKEYQRAKERLALGLPWERDPNSVPGGSKMMRTVQKVEKRCPAMKYLCTATGVASKDDAWIWWMNTPSPRL